MPSHVLQNAYNHAVSLSPWIVYIESFSFGKTNHALGLIKTTTGQHFETRGWRIFRVGTTGSSSCALVKISGFLGVRKTWCCPTLRGLRWWGRSRSYATRQWFDWILHKKNCASATFFVKGLNLLAQWSHLCQHHLIMIWFGARIMIAVECKGWQCFGWRLHKNNCASLVPFHLPHKYATGSLSIVE